MKNTSTYYENKDILVLGMAKSGYSAAKLLNQLGAKVTLNDRTSLHGDARAEELKKLGITIVDGGHPASLIQSSLDLIVKNPGIPYTNPLIQKAMEQNIPIITEVEIAGVISEADFIGITGSNGKTTTTMLIGEMMKESPFNPIVAGNIGTVLSEEAAKATSEDIIVAELSSFQLLGVETFHPKVAVYLNLYEAHLDYHGTMEHYGRAKANITKNQTKEDVLVYNADHPEVVRYIEESKATKIPFSFSGTTREGAFVKDGDVYYKDEVIMEVKDISLPKSHIENALASICAVKVFGVSNQSIKAILKSFKGVKHRLQYIEEIQGRLFYNDSKATNILATQKALAAFNQPTILLAGGLDRGNGFDSLAPSLKNVKAIITFGETKEKIAEVARQVGIKTIKTVDNVEDAVPVAYDLSQEGDVILLSPACASWDQYQSFEERGDIFINRVHMLK